MKVPKLATTTDLFLGTDGLVYVAATALALAERQERRVARVCTLTPEPP